MFGMHRYNNQKIYIGPILTYRSLFFQWQRMLPFLKTFLRQAIACRKKAKNKITLYTGPALALFE